MGKSLIIRARRAEHPEETQQATADAVGCSRQLVTKLEHEIATKNSQWEEKVAPPDWIRRHDDQAAFRRLPRLPSSEQQRLIDLPPDQRRGAVRRAAIDAGIIRLPTRLEIAQKALDRLTFEEKRQFFENLEGDARLAMIAGFRLPSLGCEQPARRTFNPPNPFRVMPAVDKLR